MQHNLMIITEVDFVKETIETRNRSLNLIIKEYKKYFNTIHVICPYMEEITYVKNVNTGIYYSTFNTYNKSIKKRLSHIMFMKKNNKRLEKLLLMNNTNLVQLRIPSIFSMSFYKIIKKLNMSLTTYIAGDWYSGFTANYTFLGSNIVANFLEKLQQPIIKNSIPVSAGIELTKKYVHLNKIYPYFSTTHTKIHKIDKNLLDKIHFLFVGRLENLKRIEDAILALKIMIDKGLNDFIFHIVGEGKEKQRLQELINNLELNKNVKFYGYISDANRMEELYSISHIFLFPSISEGTPKVLAEAMSFGTIPIAVKTTGSISSIIKHKQNGFLVGAKSPKEIAKYIEELLNDKNLYTTMVENCYEYAQEHTLQKEVEKMWKHIFTQMEYKK